MSPRPARRGLSAAMIDRLTLTDQVIQGMAASLREVAALPGSGGGSHQDVEAAERSAGGADADPPRGDRDHLRIPPQRDLGRRRPLPQGRKRGDPPGRIGGDSVEPGHRRKPFRTLWKDMGFPGRPFKLIPTTSRKAVEEMLQMEDDMDVIIPRGERS